MTDLIKVNAGFATIGQGAGPMMVTWKAGLFHKHGLDIDRPAIMGGAKGVVRGLMSGEIQFGNMARWYSDIFKFQAAYSQSLIQCGLCVVPMGAMARATDSNVAHYERAVRELPSANLSITLPILMVGLEQDENTPVVNVTACQFKSLKEIVGKGNHENRWRVINGYVEGTPMGKIGPESPLGPMLIDGLTDEAEGETAT